MLPRYRVEVRRNDTGRFEIEIYTPVEELIPFFTTEAQCESEDKAYALAEELLVLLTGHAVQEARRS